MSLITTNLTISYQFVKLCSSLGHMLSTFHFFPSLICPCICHNHNQTIGCLKPGPFSFCPLYDSLPFVQYLPPIRISYARKQSLICGGYILLEEKGSFHKRGQVENEFPARSSPRNSYHLHWAVRSSGEKSNFEMHASSHTGTITDGMYKRHNWAKSLTSQSQVFSTAK